ncbi:hypothetical protein HPB49_003169 [Dermacentor silvarum]|uniref:Uncharacterized protein n=1 Tax=Dermacentor silvarum TaxID=543639 RepID=A0ACB8DSU1_DERSI|nr:hypothetical protein HPB49_003169 [Dermacentor silvarum]
METCYNCRRIGHRQDVCPAPASGCCHNCGETHTLTEPPTCPPKCIVFGDGHHTGNIQCKYRYAHPQPRTTQPATGHQSRTWEQTPAPRKSSRSASSARSASRDRSNKPLPGPHMGRPCKEIAACLHPENSGPQRRGAPGPAGRGKPPHSPHSALTCLSYSFSLNFTSYSNTNQHRSPSITTLKKTTHHSLTACLRADRCRL